MKNKYNNIQQLIGFWQEFEELNPNSDFSSFGEWLGEEMTKKSSLASSKDNSSTQDVSEKQSGTLETNVQKHLLDVFSRLSRLQDFYTRRLFEGLPLNNLLEFNFLFSLNKKASYKKKEIIDLNLVEYTTGIDIIKRLLKLRLVDEFPDQLDKRSKRLKITSDGKRVLFDALMITNKLGHLFFDNQKHTDWGDCLQNLTELETYHAKIFSRGNSLSGYEILQIIQDKENE